MIDALQALGVSPFTATLEKVSGTSVNGPLATGESFADIMSSMASSMIGNIKNAETTSTEGIMGGASAREVVDAVMTADQTLQTAIAFRDKIVTAYLEVIKMPI